MWGNNIKEIPLGFANVRGRAQILFRGSRCWKTKTEMQRAERVLTKKQLKLEGVTADKTLIKSCQGK